MLLVKTELRPSSIHGVGVFALEHIPRGEVVWMFCPFVDIVLTKAEVEVLKLTEGGRVTLAHCWDEGELYFGHLDHVGYMNSSDHPNTVEDGETFVAARDITFGEELTSNYNSNVYLHILARLGYLDHNPITLVKKAG